MSTTEATTLPMTDRLAALCQRLSDEFEQSESVEWQTTETEIPAAAYTDPAVFDREVERLFRRMPLCLGHEDQLREPGSLLARELMGIPLLITRDREGEIRVMLNVCRHRGAKIVGDEGKVCSKSRLTCPYHAWTYGLDGSLRAIPGAAGFPKLDKGDRGLRILPSEVRDGLIWAIVDPVRQDVGVAQFLDGIAEDLSAMQLGAQRFYRQQVRHAKANWKIIMNAFQEVYHLKRLHAKTIGPFFVDTRSAGEAVGPHVRFVVARDTTAAARARPGEEWDLRQDVTLSHVVFPNNIIIWHPDYTSILSIFPVAADESLFIHTMCTPHEPHDERQSRHWERSFDMIDGGVFHEEDLFISERVQAGLKSGANDSFLIGRFEHQLRWFQDHIDAIIAD